MDVCSNAATYDDLATILKEKPSETANDCKSNTVLKTLKFRKRKSAENYCEEDANASEARVEDTFQTRSSKYLAQNDSTMTDNLNVHSIRESACRGRKGKYCRRKPLRTDSVNASMKCEYCANTVDSSSYYDSNVLCSACERLTCELDSLANITDKAPSVPDVLPREHVGVHHVQEDPGGILDGDKVQGTQDEKTQYYTPSYYTQTDGDKTPRCHDRNIDGNKENIPDKATYSQSSINNLIRNMRRSSLTELGNLPWNSSMRNDSLISSDESFVAQNLNKAMFHESDISTITISDSESTSYGNKAFIEADSRPYQNQSSFEAMSKTVDKYPTTRNKDNVRISDRTVVPSTSKQNRHSDAIHGTVRPVKYNTTQSNNVARQPVGVPKLGSRVEMEGDSNPSQECRDLWDQVRATKFSRQNILNTGFCGRESMNSLLSDASTVDYIYEDKEQGIVLRERHIPSLCGSVGSRKSIDSQFSVQSNELRNNSGGEMGRNNIDSSQETVLYDWQDDGSNKDRSVNDSSDSGTDDGTTVVSPEVMRLTNTAIRSELRKLGDDPGPVMDTTRPAYLSRLSQLRADPTIKRLGSKPPEYPPELILALDGNLDMAGVAEMEAKMFFAFQRPNRQRRWREGTLKSSFTYLLLDPRVTRNLPNRSCNMGDLDVLRCFISAIFYIGKGKRARPYCHLYEAIKHMKKNTNVKASNKVEHILAIWAADLGVVSLHCFQSVIPVEAYTREACMVDAIGLGKLTNMKRGDYYGVATTFSMKQRRTVGVYLLTKALQIFLAEGERQISPLDIRADA